MSIPSEVLEVLEPLTKAFEGCELTAYQDGGGVWTIGYGHTGLDVSLGVVWTQDQADSTLSTDLAHAYSQLLQVSPPLQKQAASRQAALTDFVYNLGVHRYAGSTLRSAVDCGSWQSVKIQLAKWNHDNGRVIAGLTRRRQAEIDLIGA